MQNPLLLQCSGLPYQKVKFVLHVFEESSHHGSQVDNVGGSVQLKHSLSLCHIAGGNRIPPLSVPCIAAKCVCAGVCVFNAYVCVAWYVYHRSPSLELRNIHSSLGWGSEIT